ncbi:MAG: dTMP kinase [Coriobacteriales bacterium]|jgi:dTMP kinase|nr:dTMP kinase [Coriobacteriales bacterium]
MQNDRDILHTLHLPATAASLRLLRAGQQVWLFGSIYTMRDAGHQRALTYLREHGELPFGLAGQALFYAGPTPPAHGRPFGAIGPTTAARMDFAAPELYAHGINLTLGKGHRASAVAQVCAHTGSVYLIAVGGAAAYLANFVTDSELVAWPDLGAEALRRLTLSGLPAFVGIDSTGATLDARTMPSAANADLGADIRDVLLAANAETAMPGQLGQVASARTMPSAENNGANSRAGLSQTAANNGTNRCIGLSQTPLRPLNDPSHPNSPGVFITFEGGEGVGKSTQIRLLQLRLEHAGYQVLVLREPGGTAIGEQIRHILLDARNAGMSDTSELLLYEAARAQLVSAVIRPALSAGQVVLCDRFSDSTLAYQSHARGLPASLVYAANGIGTQGLAPDRTILLEQDVQIGLEQATKNGTDRLEAEDLSFHQRVHDGFEILANTHPERIARVRCQDKKSQTAALVFAHLRSFFPAPLAAHFELTPELLTFARETK